MLSLAVAIKLSLLSSYQISSIFLKHLIWSRDFTKYWQYGTFSFSLPSPLESPFDPNSRTRYCGFAGKKAPSARICSIAPQKLIDKYYHERRCRFSPDIKECKSKVKEEEVTSSPVLLDERPMSTGPTRTTRTTRPTRPTRLTRPIQTTRPMRPTGPTAPTRTNRPTRPSQMVNQSVRKEEQNWYIDH